LKVSTITPSTGRFGNRGAIDTVVFVMRSSDGRQQTKNLVVDLRG
jgi:hypothetical protein